jgi:enoyl-CoA hydratase/carnithine racemase
MLRVEKIARSLSEKDPDLLRLCKEAIYRGNDLPIEDALKMEKEFAAIANANIRL